MRQWLIVLMLVLLPAQFSWAAVSAYCGHETGAGTNHLGHHEHDAHEHGHAPGDNKAGKDTPAGLSHDCGHCHGQCAALSCWADAGAVALVSAPPAARAEAPLPVRAMAPPERPQWHAAA